MVKKLIYIMLMVLLLGSCQNQNKYEQVIARADSLMESNQDSARAALVMLDGLKIHEASMGKHDRMYYQLIYAKGMNKGFVDFTTDSVMKQVVAYYDKHGSANDRMLAYYLLGCAYRDLKDSPASLDNYNKAVECADTTSNKCNYGLLAVVCGQIGYLYLNQELPKYASSALEKTKYYAEICKDTTLMLQAVSYQALAYKKMGDNQKFLEMKEDLFHQYQVYGMRKNADLELCSTICEYVNRGDLHKAKFLMDFYEKGAGLVDANGNVAEGKAVYYYTKGNYYLLCKQMDAAILAYRKLLQKAEDMDDKEKAYRGLTKAYQTLCQKDSMAKYAILTQETNDSLYRKQATATLIKMQSLYNYDQAERKAQHLAITNRYIKYMGGCGLFIILLIFGFVVVWMRQKHFKKRLAMKQKMGELHLQLLQYLRDNQDLRERITEIETPAFVNMYLKVNQTLEESEIRHLLRKKTAMGQLATDEELEKVRLLMGEFCPRFYVLVFEKENLSDKQLAVCLLVRLFFAPAELQTLLGISSGYATNVKRTLGKKLFGEEVSPKEFDERIHKMV